MQSNGRTHGDIQALAQAHKAAELQQAAQRDYFFSLANNIAANVYEQLVVDAARKALDNELANGGIAVDFERPAAIALQAAGCFMVAAGFAKPKPSPPSE